MVVRFVVPGLPVGKARPRVTMHGTYTPKITRDYEKKIRQCWFEQSGEKIPDGIPIRLTVIAKFTVPESYSKKKKKELLGKPHCKLPDLDNCIKAICDGCQGYAFSNDSCICGITAEKVYSDKPEVLVILEADENA